MNKINVALQILPMACENSYYIVDKAIEYIKSTGIKHQVCPFETVMEGDYDEIFNIIKKTQEICFNSGANQLIVNIKIQNDKNSDITIEQKMKKYQ